MEGLAVDGEKRVQGKCKCACCSEKMTDADRKKLFDDFWRVDWNRKRDFIIANTSVKDTHCMQNSWRMQQAQKKLKYFLPTSDAQMLVFLFVRSIS